MGDNVSATTGADFRVGFEQPCIAISGEPEGISWRNADDAHRPRIDEHHRTDDPGIGRELPQPNPLAQNQAREIAAGFMMGQYVAQRPAGDGEEIGAGLSDLPCTTCARAKHYRFGGDAIERERVNETLTVPLPGPD